MNLIQNTVIPNRQADIAIDFGTANTRIFVRGSGIVFEEPSLCCFDDASGHPKFVAAGAQVSKMFDRTSGSVRVVRPLARGVLYDIDAGREMLRHAVKLSLGRRRLRTTRAIVGIPSDATQAEQAALITAAEDSGLRVVQLIHEPLAAALGAGLPVDQPQGSMLIECGAGTTEVVVISLGAICLKRSVRVGGASLDQEIADYLRSEHKFLIGAETAERVKLEIAALLIADVEKFPEVVVMGQNSMSGGPGTLVLNAQQIVNVVNRHVAKILDVVRDVLNNTPAELSRDIHDRGLVLTGGSASVILLQHAIMDATGLPTSVASEPLTCVARGLGVILS